MVEWILPGRGERLHFARGPDRLRPALQQIRGAGAIHRPFDVLRRSAAPQGGWTQQTETRSKAKVVAVTPDKASAVAAAPALDRDDGTLPVRAPLIGTFYRAPKPGAPPFVDAGTKVTADTVVGIVETMKLMNSVMAGTAGVIVAIEAADGEFVEQNHVLMRVQPVT